MRAGLWYVRNLVDDEVIECMLSLDLDDQMPPELIPSAWRSAWALACQALTVSSELPPAPLTSLSALVRMIPQSIPAGTQLPKYEVVNGVGIFSTWTAPHRYLFEAGSAYPFLLGSLYGVYPVALPGLALTYSAIVRVPSIVPAEDDPNYRPPYYFRSGLVLRMPAQTTYQTVTQIMAQKSVVHDSGYWRVWQTRCRIQFLWCYPSCTESWDMRQGASNEELEALSSLQDVQIVDNDENFSWLPAPTFSGAYRELNGQGNGAIDYLPGLSSPYPVVIWRPWERPGRTIPVRFPPLPVSKIKGGLSVFTPGGLLLSIADKLLTLNGLLARIRED